VLGVVVPDEQGRVLLLRRNGEGTRGVPGDGWYGRRDVTLSRPGQDSSALHVTMPSAGAPFSGGGSVPTAWVRIANVTTGLALDSGGSVADSWGDATNGAPARQTTWNGGNNQQWRLNSVGNGRYPRTRVPTTSGRSRQPDSGNRRPLPGEVSHECS
jgi:hypothetical protein